MEEVTRGEMWKEKNFPFNCTVNWRKIYCTKENLYQLFTFYLRLILISFGWNIFMFLKLSGDFPIHLGKLL